MGLPGRMIEVRGTRLHVYDEGDPAGPVMLFVHGGPGQGCLDFFHHQASSLGQRVRLVGVDQRGSLFSDPLRPGERVSETDTVDDLEALREALGIERWAVLGQSFGTRIALRYALRHPARVGAALFENPVWDHARSAVTQTEAVLSLLQRSGGDTADAQALLAQAGPITSAQRRRLVDSIGDAQAALWFHHPERLAGNPFPSTELPAEIAARSEAAAHQLLEHPQLDESLPLLLPQLRVRSLLLLGLHDCVTDDDSIELFNAHVEDGDVAWFEESGHFCHMEEPQAYAQVVGDFVTRT